MVRHLRTHSVNLIGNGGEVKWAETGTGVNAFQFPVWWSKTKSDKVNGCRRAF